MVVQTALFHSDAIPISIFLPQNSPVGRPNSVSHNEPGNEARCSFSHVSEIFKLKNIINAQLTTIAEKQLTIDKQSNMLREYKDENEMVMIVSPSS